MLLHEGLTRVHSQKDPRLHFGESFALNCLKFRFVKSLIPQTSYLT